MLPVAGRPLLEYKLDALPEEIDEVIMIVGYLGNVIREHFGSAYGNKKIKYVEQQELNGTAGALWSAQSLLHDRFLIMMGDDIYAKKDIEESLAKTDSWTLLVQGLPELYRAGRVELNSEGHIENIIESDREDEKRKEPGIASTNLYIVDTRLFTFPLVPKHEGSLEFGLPQTVVAAAKSLGVVFEPIYTDSWIQITAPKDLVAAEKMLKNQDK